MTKKLIALSLYAVGLLIIYPLTGTCEEVDMSYCPDQFPEEVKVPLGLPPIPWPEDNPYSKEKAELGYLLYFDKRLSSDGTVSCASCHQIPKAFTDRSAVSIGIHNHHGNRHSPTIIDSAYAKLLFWDGRAHSLEEQSMGPIANPKEMSAYTDIQKAHFECTKRICGIAGYHKLFRKVFEHEGCSIQNIAKAIATFERTILSGNSPYDRYQNGDKTALTAEQIHGMAVFKKSGCVNCHNGPLFTDGRFLNIGIGMDKPDPDLGRYVITQDLKDWGAFRTPTLREVKNTYPYMHDGSLKTLDEVIDYYDRGGIKNRNLHPLLNPLHLSVEDKQALKSFLEALSGEGWQHVQEPKIFPE